MSMRLKEQACWHRCCMTEYKLCRDPSIRWVASRVVSNAWPRRRSFFNPHTLNGITEYPLALWIIVIIGNYGTSGSFAFPPRFCSRLVLASFETPLRNCRIWGCVIRRTLSVSAIARCNPSLPTLAVKCRQLCTVICSSVHLNQSCPDASVFCRFVYVNISYARVYLYTR